MFVNTLYNCLATPSERHSFTPIWKPPFISKIIKEDRCHLNGLAMEDGVPRYVTAVSKSDTIDGWRDRRFDGGIIVDVPSGEIVIGGLSMPHSPRSIAASSGCSTQAPAGRLDRARRRRGQQVPSSRLLPGLRARAPFHGNYAFVGLSKPRYQRFEGLALDKRLAEMNSEPWCGVQVIDLDTGACVTGSASMVRWRSFTTSASCQARAADGARLRHQRDSGLITHDPLEASPLA